MSEQTTRPRDIFDDVAGVQNPHLAALVELLIALPPIPEHWPAGAVQDALNKALAAYEGAKANG